MNIANCIFINDEHDEVKQLKVFYDNNSAEIITMNLEDAEVSKIVSESGGIEKIEKNTKEYNIAFEKEHILYEKFKKYMSLNDELSLVLTKNYTEEELFNLKMWVFEQPEVENCKDRELKKKIRTSKDIIEIIGVYYQIKST